MQRNNNTQPLHLSTVTLSRLHHTNPLLFRDAMPVYNATPAKHHHAAPLQFHDIPTPVLGTGWSDDKQMAAQLQCFVQGNITFSGGSKSTIYFSDATTFQEVERTLNVDVSASLKIDLFSFDASASYARYIDTKHYTQDFYFVEKVSLPTQIWEPTHYGTGALSEIGQEVYKSGPQQFRDVCGNKIVQQVHLGASLIATLKIDFASYYDKETFTAKAGGSWGDIISVSAKIQKVVIENNIQGTLEFSAYQSGGDASQLAKIFINCGGHYCITSCSLTNLDACQSTIDGVVKYAQDNFPAQIDFQNGKVLGSAAPVSYTYLDTSAIGLDSGVSVLNASNIAARQEMGDLYQAQGINSTFVKHLLDSPLASHMYSNTITELRMANNALDHNLALLSDENSGALGCYFYPTKCPALRDALLQQMQPVDVNFLNAMDRGFTINGQAQDCNTGGAEIVASINSFIFPGDANSSNYFIASKLSLALALTTNRGTLTISGAGAQCPIAYKSSSYDEYDFITCPCCDGINCMIALGATYHGEACTNPSCSGTVHIIIELHNPL